MCRTWKFHSVPKTTPSILYAQISPPADMPEVLRLVGGCQLLWPCVYPIVHPRSLKNRNLPKHMGGKTAEPLRRQKRVNSIFYAPLLTLYVRKSLPKFQPKAWRGESIQRPHPRKLADLIYWEIEPDSRINPSFAASNNKDSRLPREEAQGLPGEPQWYLFIFYLTPLH